MDAVEFVAEFGARFLRLYAFDPVKGVWSHREYREIHDEFTLDAALTATGCDATALPLAERSRLYAEALADARRWADRLGAADARQAGMAAGMFGELQFFHVD
jgi:hypothetical protein